MCKCTAALNDSRGYTNARPGLRTAIWNQVFYEEKHARKVFLIVATSYINYEVKWSAVYLYLRCHLWILFSLESWKRFPFKYSIWLSYRVHTQKQHLILTALSHVLRHCPCPLGIWELDTGRHHKPQRNTRCACTCFHEPYYHLPQLDYGKGGRNQEAGSTEPRCLQSDGGGGQPCLKLLVIYQKPPALSGWDGFRYDKRGLHATNRHSSGKTADLKTWERYSTAKW